MNMKKIYLSVFSPIIASLIIQGCSYRSLGRKEFETRMDSNPPANLSIMNCQTQNPAEVLNISSLESLQYQDDKFIITTSSTSPTKVQITVIEQLPNLTKTCFYSLEKESFSLQKLDAPLINSLMKWTEEIEH